MSIWGQLYAGSTTVVGRVMHAVEKRANGYHNASEWTGTRDDWSDGRPDAEHPSMLDAMEKEIAGEIEPLIAALESLLESCARGELPALGMGDRINAERQARAAIAAARGGGK